MNFILNINGTPYQIDEPTNWNEITLNLDRDLEYHGLNQTYSDGQFDLRFERTHLEYGHQFDLLLEQYLTKGFESDIYLEFNGQFFGYLEIESARTDLCTYIDCPILEKKPSRVIIDKFDVGVDVFSPKTLNDEIVDVNKTSLTLTEVKVSGGATLFANNEIVHSDDAEGYKLFPLMPNVTNVFNTPINSQSFTMQNLTVNPFLPQIYSQLAQQMIDNGFTNIGSPLGIDSIIKVEIDIDINTGTPDVYNDYDIAVVVYTGYNGGGYVFAKFEQVIPLHQVIKNQNVNLSGYGEVNLASYEVFGICLFIEHPDGEQGLNNFILRQCSKINVQIVKNVPEIRNVDAIQIKTFMENVVNRVSDNTLTLSMPEFNIGKFKDYYLTNGFAIRKKTAPFYTNFKECIEALKMSFACGYQLNESEVYIGTVDTFYDDVEVYDFNEGAFSDYEVEISDDFKLNKIRLEYKNREKDQQQTLYDVHTKSEYFLNNQKVKDSLELNSEWIASAFTTQTLRDLEEIVQEGCTSINSDQIDGESTDYDEKTFIFNTIFDGVLKTRTSQNADLTGVNDPLGFYNAELSLARCLYRNLKYYGTALYFNIINGIQNIKTTFFEANVNFTSAIFDSDIQGLIPENLDTDNVPTPILKPFIHSGNWRICYEDLYNMYANLRSQKGYVSILNNKGEKIKIYPIEMSYQIQTEILTLKGIEKYV